MLVLLIKCSISVLILVASWTTIAEGFVLQKSDSANISSIDSSHSSQQYSSADNINGSSQSVVLRTLLSIHNDSVLLRSKREKRNNRNGKKRNKNKIMPTAVHMVIDYNRAGYPSEPVLETKSHQRVEFWKMFNIDMNYKQKFASFHEASGTVEIMEKGLYMIYARMGFYTNVLNVTSMFVVKIGRGDEYEQHEPKMRCMEIEKVVKTSGDLMEVCGKTGTFYLQEGDRISIQGVHTFPIVDDINETFWGVIKV